MVQGRWVLVRHAPARSRDFVRWPDDRGRPLKPGGRREFEDASHGLRSLLEGRGNAATSPLARAAETAEILGKVWPPARRLQTWKELEPEGDLVALFRRASAARGRGDLVLVGHEPQLSRLVGYCVLGEGTSVLKFSKGGAVAIDFPGPVRPGGGRLLWALTRGQLCRVRARRSSRGARRGRPSRAPKEKGDEG
ncbi:MAG: histidine phosphatase family protein [Euryarchaeota archaeon]|nr:histidine phosphatase family protein [Euryarchaeota archaeon]MDE1837580.1 histidine phosphatase family protein [Euryarchaeota archaeon]MDE1881319.1 histidine phosphatase family protein [Euryarchaeota archaeon]MDE2045891.1 histidine phosphatase family protein [Thermoplasmata archaeon]